MTDLDSLEKLAREATRGSWYFRPWHVAEGPSQVRVKTETEDYLLCELPGDAFAAYIAALSPDVCLELIAALKKMRKVLEWLDRRGGLGYEAHDSIHDALAATSQKEQS